MKFSRWLLLLVFCLLAGPAGAEIHKWVDENGVVHYSERPPQGQTSSEVEISEWISPEQVKEGENVYRDTVQQQQARNDSSEAQRDLESARRKAARNRTRNECKKAEREIKILKIQCPVFYDGHGILRYRCPRQPSREYEGELRYVGDEERASKIEHDEKLLAKCRELD